MEHHGLYSYAWAIRALAFLTELDEPELSMYKEPLRKMAAAEELKKLAAAALSDPASIADPKKSPLTVKKEHYDQTLVGTLTKAKPGTQLELLVGEIKSKTTGEVSASKSDVSKLKAMFRRMMSMPPEFKPVSGVRELSFAPEPASILVPDGTMTPVPFSYMLQVAERHRQPSPRVPVGKRTRTNTHARRHGYPEFDVSVAPVFFPLRLLPPRRRCRVKSLRPTTYGSRRGRVPNPEVCSAHRARPPAR